jgi:hypothetical protein
MNVSSVTTFGSAAIASPPANDSPAAGLKPDDKPAVQPVEPAAKPPGTGQFVDKSV